MLSWSVGDETVNDELGNLLRGRGPHPGVWSPRACLKSQQDFGGTTFALIVEMVTLQRVLARERTLMLRWFLSTLLIAGSSACTGALVTPGPAPTPGAPPPSGYDAGPTQPPPGPGPTTPGPEMPGPVVDGTWQLATGVRVRNVSAFQVLEIPLDDGLPAAQRLVPLLTNKDTLFRILVDTDPTWVPQAVRAIVDVNGTPFQADLTVAGASDPRQRATFFAVQVPGAQIQAASTVRVRLLQAGTGPTEQVGHPATWPATGVPQPLGAVQSPELKIVLVQVNHAASGALGRVDLTPDKVDRVRKSFLATYPVSPDRLQITVRPGHYELTTPSANPSGCESWEGGTMLPVTCFPDNELIDEMRLLMERENASPDAVYIGVFSYDTSRFSAIGGLGTGSTREEVLANTGSRFASIATWLNTDDEVGKVYGGGQSDSSTIAWEAESRGVPLEGARLSIEHITNGEGSRETMLHEVGHCLSLGHLEYSTDPMMRNYLDNDPSLEPHYPRPLGTQGRDGYDTRFDEFIPADVGFDMMSYGLYSFISDVNYRALFDVLNATTISRQLYAAPQRSHHINATVRLHHGLVTSAQYRRELQWAPPRSDEHLIRIAVRDAHGRVIDQVMGQLIRNTDDDSGSLYVPTVEGAAAYEVIQFGRRVTIRVPASAIVH